MARRLAKATPKAIRAEVDRCVAALYKHGTKHFAGAENVVFNCAIKKFERSGGYMRTAAEERRAQRVWFTAKQVVGNLARVDRARQGSRRRVDAWQRGGTFTQPHRRRR